jgi:hypothetical protein
MRLRNPLRISRLSRHSRESGNPFIRLLHALLWIPACAGMTAVLLAGSPASAAEATYKPENCEFQMKFPEAPYSTRHCNPDLPDKCELKTAFTKVYGTEATMNFYVSCNPIPPEGYKSYDRDVLRTMLLAMAGRDRLVNYQTAYDEDTDVKRGSLLGAGPSYNKKHPMLYMGEIWIGQHSMMTVEGELIGEANPDTDAAFAKILQSITSNKWAEEDAKKAAETKDDKSSGDKKDSENKDKDDKKDADKDSGKPK